MGEQPFAPTVLYRFLVNVCIFSISVIAITPDPLGLAGVAISSVKCINLKSLTFVYHNLYSII